MIKILGGIYLIPLGNGVEFGLWCMAPNYMAPNYKNLQYLGQSRDGLMNTLNR